MDISEATYSAGPGPPEGPGEDERALPAFSGSPLSVSPILLCLCSVWTRGSEAIDSGEAVFPDGCNQLIAADRRPQNATLRSQISDLGSSLERGAWLFHLILLCVFIFRCVFVFCFLIFALALALALISRRVSIDWMN